MVIQWRGDRLLDLGDVSVTDLVELAGGHARADVLADHIENLRGQSAGQPHLVDLVVGLDVDCS